MSRSQRHKILANALPDASREVFLRTFYLDKGGVFLRLVQEKIEGLCRGYPFGTWQCVTLSNGGAFVYPVGEPGLAHDVDRRHLAELEPDQLGLVGSLFALSELSRMTRNEFYGDQYLLLYHYVNDMNQAETIMRFLD